MGWTEPTYDTTVEDSLRSELTGLLSDESREFDGDDPWWAIAATQTRPVAREHAQAAAAGQPAPDSGGAHEWLCRSPDGAPAGFIPREPKSLEETGLTRSEVEALALKLLLNRGGATGMEIAEQVKLPFRIIGNLLRRFKDEQLVVYKAAAPMNDYLHELTDQGFERARRYSAQCTYFGAAPVPLAHYRAAVEAQSVTKQSPRLDDLRRAFADLVLSREMLSQLGQAINSGLGLFLYGAPGNGKTSMAERVTKTLGEDVWIPRAISVLGEIIRIYDPTNHEVMPSVDPDGRVGETRIDRRWIRIRRPTIVVGGELTMDNLEMITNAATGISEAPLQMKANGGVLVIDDFGRQRISPTELLNRWIVPLEKRYDFLSLGSGRKIQVPFDQFIIFSTNLEPRNLVDEAFLRRIPYKIDVSDPTEAEFRLLFRRLAEATGIEHCEKSVDYLIERHYREPGRPMRFCHPRDLVSQMRIYCSFHERRMVITEEAVDAAVRNYFAML